jgi:hypothetical protein
VHVLTESQGKIEADKLEKSNMLYVAQARRTNSMPHFDACKIW